jgi:hypothetical protein
VNGYGSKQDLALFDIWLFGESLSHDFFPHRLNGKEALPSKFREMADRCLLFLQSDLEYEWPSWPKTSRYYYPFFLGALLVVASLYIDWIAIKIGLAIAGFAITLLALLLGKREQKQQIGAYWQRDDRRVWPFLRISDYENELRKQNRKERGTA